MKSKLIQSKTITIYLFFFILILFILSYFLQYYLLNYRGNFQETLFELKTEANNQNWEEAQELYDELDHTWNTSRHIVSLNFAESDYSDLDVAIHTLQGAIETQDINTINQKIYEINEYYKNLSRIIPEP